MVNRKEYKAEWYQKNREKLKQYRLEHKRERNECSRRWYYEHRQEQKIRAKQYNLATKREALVYYGNGELACVLCGFDDVRALSIDHIKGRGTQHRRGWGGIKIYLWLKQQGYPGGYQTLCMNCQFIKRAENKEYAPYGVVSGT